ncbi:MAG TPA: hypothetical protein VF690_08315 [Hymenobacter sp.]|jgi:hypothetical protein
MCTDPNAFLLLFLLIGAGGVLVAAACWRVMKLGFAGLINQQERTARSKWLAFARITALLTTGAVLVAALLVVLTVLILLMD